MGRSLPLLKTAVQMAGWGAIRMAPQHAALPRPALPWKLGGGAPECPGGCRSVAWSREGEGWAPGGCLLGLR